MDNARTCLGCRLRSPRTALLRLVVRNGQVVPDPSATQDGRGAWVHPTSECVAVAVKRKAFGRAFRVTTGLDSTPLALWLGDHLVALDEQAE